MPKNNKAGVSRRDFVATTAAGATAAVLAPGHVSAQEADRQWDLTADFVSIGAGCFRSRLCRLRPRARCVCDPRRREHRHRRPRHGLRRHRESRRRASCAAAHTGSRIRPTRSTRTGRAPIIRVRDTTIATSYAYSRTRTPRLSTGSWTTGRAVPRERGFTTGDCDDRAATGAHAAVAEQGRDLHSRS